MTDLPEQTRPQSPATTGAWGGATPGATTPGETTPGATTPGETTPGATTPAETTTAAAETTTAAAVPAETAGSAGPAPGGTTAHRIDAVRDRAEAVVERAGDAMERAAAASGRVATAMIDRLRNEAEYQADRGSTRIEDEVVEKIAGIAAREVPGVHDLGGDTARFFAAVKERVGLSEGGDRGVSARLDGRTARIGVTLVVEYGVPVYPVTEQVRAKVIEAVEGMLDLQVLEVNVVVDDVEVPEQHRR
jgi:uncharacterized alkaline shock family protein YloU